MVRHRMPGEPDYYLFVIDTDTDTEDIALKMCAYVTGQIGECEDGEYNTVNEIADLLRREVPDVVARLEELVDQVLDRNGRYKPVSTFPTPGWFSHGHGGYFRDGQENEALVDYKLKTKEWNEQALEGYHESIRDKMRARYQQMTNETNALTEVHKYPAYMSVAIYFHTIPDADLIDVMKQRARDITKNGVGSKGFKRQVGIVGFRLLEQHTTYKELHL